MRFLIVFVKNVCVALCVLAFFHDFSFAKQDDEAREFLLSADFFSDFYGTDVEDLTSFIADRKTITLPFASDKDAGRACLDAPLNVDCSTFSAFEIAFEIDDPGAIGSVTLYFHSKSGWYHYSSSSKRGFGSKFIYVFNANHYSTEGNPAGLDQIDAVRLAIWRGGDVDATVTMSSFRASKTSFAIVNVDDQGGENGSFVRSFSDMLSRFGLSAERVEGTSISGESLKRYSVVFLPIAGKISPDAVDALCEYVDQGGFLFACYNVPAKLMEKMGIKSTGFVNCAREGFALKEMTFQESFIKDSLKKGFTVPQTIQQNSWNFFKVQPIVGWKSSRDSELFEGRSSRVLAYWTLEDGKIIDYPALIASPVGVYCSHVFLTSDYDAKKAFLETIVASVNPQIAKSFARSEWLSIFDVGLMPDADVDKESDATLNFLEKELSDRGWTLDDAVRLMDCARKDFTFAEVSKFGSDVAEIKKKRVESYCKSRKSKDFEGRLWWEHSGCGVYPGDWDRTMKELSEAGFNAVIPNMLWGGDAYYQSDVLPVDPKVEKYGDQIEQAVAAGKKYGVEVHAWMVCFNASNSPKWFLDKMREEGRLQRTIDGEEKPWLCPSHPENRALQLAALEEVAFKYDVDGVHFDYIRFPDETTCYCDGCKERFAQAYREKTGKTLTDFPNCLLRDQEVKETFQEWRCDQITALVRDVHKSLKGRRPDIKLSAAVFSGYPGTKKSIGQDWGLWVDEGLLDFVCPMDYTSDPSAFANYVRRQLPITKDKVPLYPGIGMTATGISMKADEVVRQAEIARELGAQGFTIFNLAKSTADEALPAMKKGTTSQDAKTPHSK
ncbi:MAG: family 10 glycosylhydrolase [Thermoguttaceae bacterium]|nr:family 10 glycosylhydrolase [Thermoguttaceae bacterium]